MEVLPLLGIIITSLLFSAFFSGTEIAFVSINRLRIELRSKKGLDTAKIISGFLESPSSFISALLVGNNIALVIYGSAMAALLEPLIISLLEKANTSSDFLVLLIQTIISTIIVLIFGEFIPKSIFRIRPHKLLSFFALPLKYFYAVVKFIFLWFINFLSNFFLKVFFGLDDRDQQDDFTKFELFHFMEESTNFGTSEETEVDMNYFQKALFLTDIKARECMVHRTELVGIDFDKSVDELKAKFIDSEHSKILVYKETIDNIIGFVHFSDLFEAPTSIESITKAITVVPESMPGMDLLKKLTQEQTSMALVVDEFGGTSGIVALEDVIEEIFGEIEDEHDIEELVEVQLSDSEYIFSARHEVDYINEKYQLGLPNGDYETLGGLIFHVCESIPSQNDIINLGDGAQLTVKILSVSPTRIEKVKISVNHLESEV